MASITGRVPPRHSCFIVSHYTSLKKFLMIVKVNRHWPHHRTYVVWHVSFILNKLRTHLFYCVILPLYRWLATTHCQWLSCVCCRQWHLDYLRHTNTAQESLHTGQHMNNNFSPHFSTNIDPKQDRKKYIVYVALKGADSPKSYGTMLCVLSYASFMSITNLKAHKCYVYYD